jgi:CelD/BcsL family acetyltransferase involved in cellulose biosynthesis
MDAQSSVVPLLFDLAKQVRLNIQEVWRIPCLYINLPSSFEEYLSQLGRKKRQDIRRRMRRLGEMGDVRFKMAETEGEIGASRDTLIRLHQSRWSQRGKPGVFSSDRFRLFHDKMIPIAHRKNWLRLGTLFLDERPLACVYNFHFMSKIYGYQLGMEISETPYSGYGSLALVYAISHAISEGMREYDLLTGTPDYKRRLAKERREVVTLRISRSSPRESLYRAMCRIKRQAKPLLQTARDHLWRRRNGE